MSGAIQTDLSEEDIERIQQVIKEFLDQPGYSGLYETRIQKLIFFTEVYCVLHYRRRMTRAGYKPYMFGAYSEDLSIALEDINGEVGRKKKIRNGKRTVFYSLAKDFSESGLDSDSQRVISIVHQSTRNRKTDDLAQFSKDNPLFERTEYNTPMKFHEFAVALDDEDWAQEELENKMPRKIPIDEDNLLPIPNYEERN